MDAILLENWMWKKKSGAKYRRIHFKPSPEKTEIELDW